MRRNRLKGIGGKVAIKNIFSKNYDGESMSERE